MWNVVNTDNFGGDYPNESFASSLPFEREEDAENLAFELNEMCGGEYALRYYKVVKLPYILQPGFEP